MMVFPFVVEVCVICYRQTSDDEHVCVASSAIFEKEAVILI